MDTAHAFSASLPSVLGIFAQPVSGPARRARPGPLLQLAKPVVDPALLSAACHHEFGDGETGRAAVASTASSRATSGSPLLASPAAQPPRSGGTGSAWPRPAGGVAGRRPGWGRRQGGGRPPGRRPRPAGRSVGVVRRAGGPGRCWPDRRGRAGGCSRRYQRPEIVRTRRPAGDLVIADMTGSVARPAQASTRWAARPYRNVLYVILNDVLTVPTPSRRRCVGSLRGLPANSPARRMPSPAVAA